MRYFLNPYNVAKTEIRNPKLESHPAVSNRAHGSLEGEMTDQGRRPEAGKDIPDMLRVSSRRIYESGCQ